MKKIILDSEMITNYNIENKNQNLSSTNQSQGDK